MTRRTSRPGTDIDQSLETLQAELSSARKQIAYLTSLAERDPLTGLFNRRGLRRVIEQALDDCRRMGRSGCVIFLDLDGFKAVNDRLGHMAGDHVLQVVAERLSAALGRYDAVGRVGGDEFVILLKEADESDARARLEAAFRQASATGLAAEDGAYLDLHVQLSFGIAGLANDLALGEILMRADRLMLENKSSDVTSRLSFVCRLPKF